MKNSIVSSSFVKDDRKTFVYEYKLNNERDCDLFLSKFFSNEKIYKIEDIKIYKDNTEVKFETFDFLSINKFDNKKNSESHSASSQENIALENQITLENIYESMNKEKLYEIFFIYGDIVDIQIKKDEVINKKY